MSSLFYILPRNASIRILFNITNTYTTTALDSHIHILHQQKFANRFSFRVQISIVLQNNLYVSEVILNLD